MPLETIEQFHYLIFNRPVLHRIRESVEYVDAAGQPCRAQLRSGGEVLLSAGAVQSPQILMLSGVGPRAHLEAHGIEVRKELSGVGEGLHLVHVPGVFAEGPARRAPRRAQPPRELDQPEHAHDPQQREVGEAVGARERDELERERMEQIGRRGRARLQRTARAARRRSWSRVRRGASTPPRASPPPHSLRPSDNYAGRQTEGQTPLHLEMARSKPRQTWLHTT